MKSTHSAKTGNPGGSLSAADLLKQFGLCAENVVAQTKALLKK